MVEYFEQLEQKDIALLSYLQESLRVISTTRL